MTKYLSTHRIKGISISPRGSVGRLDTNVAGQEASTLVAKTQYRYCIDKQLEDLEIICGDDANVSDSFLTQNDSRTAENEKTIWHRIWMGHTGQPTTVNKNPFWSNVPYKRSNFFADQTWRQGDDFSYWASTDWGIALGLVVPSATQTALTGRFWVNGDSLVGTAINTGTGLHLNDHPLSPSDASEQLSNHYEPANPISVSERTDYRTIPRVKPALAWKYCPNCVKENFPQLGDDCPTCVGALPRPVLSTPYESQLVVTLPTSLDLPQKHGNLLRDGSFAPIDERLGTGLQDVLSNTTLRLANQEEAISHIGLGGAMPSTLAISADGTDVVARIALRGRSFDVLGRSTTAPGMRMTQEEPALTPEPREKFEPVYSRAEGKLFIVGGESPTNHAPVGTIWWRDVEDGGTWSKVPLAGYAPASVLASTYSYRDKKLWVLDELKVGGLKRARLVRLDPTTGDFEQIGQWLRLGLYNQHWLVLDKDGEVLLVASSSSTKKHTVVRFDNHGAALTLDRIFFGLGTLAFKPMVDEDGYSFVIDKNIFGSTHNTETLRLKTPGWLPALWQQLTACW